MYLGDAYLDSCFSKSPYESSGCSSEDIEPIQLELLLESPVFIQRRKEPVADVYLIIT
jgi:hypothetical protein